MAERAVEQESEFLKAFREIYEEGNRAWNEGDFERAYSALPADFEYEVAPTWPNARPLRGPDEVVAFFEDLRETFRDVRTEPPKFFEVDERTVIVGFRVIGTGRSSGAGTAMDVWQVWRMREGMVPAHVTEFLDRCSAFEAAGAEDRMERGT